MSPNPNPRPMSMPLKCALCHQAYATLMMPGAISEITGCTTVQVMACCNYPIHHKIVEELDCNRFRVLWRDAPGFGIEVTG